MRPACLGSATLALLLVGLLTSPRALDARDDSHAVTRVPLRVDFVGDDRLLVPVTGGVPLPRGALASPDHVRVLRGGVEVPAQVLRAAVWPDGSVKWILVDLVVSPAKTKGLVLEYGAGVTRSKIDKPLEVREQSGGWKVTGPGLSAHVAADGSLGPLRVEGREVFTARAGATLELEALRVSGPDAFPGPSRVCEDESARASVGTVEIDDMQVEVRGPLRTRICVRGSFRLPRWGADLPARVLAREPAGRVPFSLRFTFHRGLPLVTVSHQLVYTGEPDRDVITRWGFQLPGQGTGHVRLIEEPGVTTDHAGRREHRSEDRPCAASLKAGFALIRAGWENRPCLVGGGANGDASVDFWPREAGVFDLRRSAREWGVGESGNRDRPADMERYARYAARGLAKSHVFLLHFGGRDAGEARGVRETFAEPALLVAPPGWYAASGALGTYVASGGAKAPYADLDAGVRRYLDYFLFNQDLYRWHGKLAYGFWQTRNGSIHRHDRWDRDYGRWGWSLGDGAGRIGHVLLLTYLRTLERRYFRAGAAFHRAVYDTSMVHTESHLENTQLTGWSVKGCNHRHNVQPFGGPYIGMRGSYPGGHRIQYFLTGDGVLRDGLDIVAAAALDYATRKRPGAFGASGGSDGQGAGALALLFAYETTGEPAYLDACRALLLASGLFPPADPERLGYGPDFGLHLAGAEYVDLTDDEAFEARLLETADLALEGKVAPRCLGVIACAFRRSGKTRYREALARILDGLDVSGTLAEEPRERWPGHGGWRRAPSRANLGRDLPYALAALSTRNPSNAWPPPAGKALSHPARVPEDWPRPGGTPRRADKAPTPDALLRRAASRQTLDAPFALPEPFVVLCRDDEAGNPRVTRVIEKPIRGIRFALKTRDVQVQGVRSKRLEMAVSVRAAGEQVAAWGVAVPFPLAGDLHAVQVQAAGAFRVERWRVDASDEKIPGWLNSDARTRWPRWREGGLLLLPGGAYRIYKQNRPDTAPLYVDDGFGAPGWLDVTDRGADVHRGLTVRMLPGSSADAVRSVAFDAETQRLVVCFHASSGRPLDPRNGPFSGAADLIAHDGWRPPLLPPALDREQYRAFLDDLDDGPTLGLFALRFLLSETHQVDGKAYKDRLAKRGIEPRALLLSMRWRDGLELFCRRIGVRYDPERIEATIERVIQRYR